MIKILLASHGTFAEGIKNALELIVGKQPGVETLCAYVGGETDAKRKIHQFLERIKPEEDWIVVTDVFGGSVNNEFFNCLPTHKIHLISGMNLPMLVELVTNSSEKPEEKIKSALTVAREEVRYCNSMLSDSLNHPEPEEDF